MKHYNAKRTIYMFLNGNDNTKPGNKSWYYWLIVKDVDTMQACDNVLTLRRYRDKVA